MLKHTKKVLILPAMIILIACLFSFPAIAADACEGCTPGTFNGSPACLKEGKLHICVTNIPNYSLQSYISDMLDKDGDQTITEAEANSLTAIRCSYCRMDTMRGTEYFPNLEELQLAGNRISSIDLARYPKLHTLNISANPIYSIDISGNPMLSTLNISRTYLYEINLQQAAKLTTLICNDTNLTSLDLTNCVNLNVLNCSKTQLKALNLSANVQLHTLDCSENQLNALDLTSCPQLRSLKCGENFLMKLDLSNCSMLETAELGTQRPRVSVDMIKADNGTSFIVAVGSIVGPENLQHITEIKPDVFPRPETNYDNETGILLLSKYCRSIVYTQRFPCPSPYLTSTPFMVIEMSVNCLHEWVEVTCSKPQHCSICNKQEGKTLEHTWLPATKTEPEICSVCGAEGGHPLEHVWWKATCTVAASCKYCDATNGSKLGHDIKTTITVACKRVHSCTRCGKKLSVSTEHTWYYSSPRTLKCSKCDETRSSSSTNVDVEHICEWSVSSNCEKSKCIYCGKDNPNRSHNWFGPTFLLPQHCTNYGCSAKGAPCYFTQYLVHITLTVDLLYLIFATGYLSCLRKEKIHISFSVWYTYLLNREKNY